MFRLRRFVGWPQAAVALLVTSVVFSAVAGGYYEQEAPEDQQGYGYSGDWQEIQKKRKEILAKIPTDPTVLINVTYDLMPGTPQLTALGRKATRALMRGLLDNAGDDVRALCVSVLSEIRDPESAPALVEALGDRSYSVRIGAVWGLGNLADPGHGRVLMSRVEDPEESQYVKKAAIGAIGNIGYTKAIPKLEKLVTGKKNSPLAWDSLQALWHMRNRADRDDLVDVFLHVLKKGKAGAPLAVDYLGALKADEADKVLADYYVGKDENMKNRIILTMGKIGSSRAKEFLKKVMKTTQVARHLNNAAIQLSRLGEDKEAIAILADLLKDRKAYMRINAAFALGEVGGDNRKVVDGLITALQDQNDYVRSEAAVALGRLKAAGATDALLKLASSDNPFTQLDAVVALNRIDYDKHRSLIIDKLIVPHKNKPRYLRIYERGIRFLAEKQDKEALPYLLAYLRSAQTGSYGQYLELLREYGKDATAEFLPSINYLTHTCTYVCFSELLRTLRTWKLSSQTTGLLERLYRSYYSADKTLIYFTLGKIGGKDIVQAISMMKETGHTVRLYRLFALANLGDKKALDDLIDILVTGILDDKRDVAFLLGALDIKDADERLEKLIKTDDPFTAVAAAAALLTRGNKNAYEFLYKTMREGVPIVADEAERALLVSTREDIEKFLKTSLKQEKSVVAQKRLEEILYRRAPKEFR